MRPSKRTQEWRRMSPAQRVRFRRREIHRDRLIAQWVAIGAVVLFIAWIWVYR